MDPYAGAEAYFGLLAEPRSLLEGNVDLVMVGAVMGFNESHDDLGGHYLLLSV
jgi:hypothetical protein